MDEPKIVVLIPAYNEAHTIVATIDATQSIAGVSSIYVVDDGSRDNTAKLAQQTSATVLRRQKNGGKGAALQFAAEQLLADTAAGMQIVPDIVLLLDADLDTSAAEAHNLTYPVVDNLADMTIGVLPTPKGSGGFGAVKDLARRAIRERGGGYDAQAPLSGQRALSWQCFNAVLPFARGFGVEVALTIQALKQNFRIYEVQVDMYHRATGKDVSGFLHRGKQYLDVYNTIRRLG